MYRYDLISIDEGINSNFVNCNESQFYMLENHLQKLIENYEIEVDGNSYTDINKYTMFRDGGLSIVDGILGCYIMNDVAISRAFLTCKNQIILECYPVNTYNGEPDYDLDSFYMLLV